RGRGVARAETSAARGGIGARGALGRAGAHVHARVRVLEGLRGRKAGARGEQAKGAVDVALARRVLEARNPSRDVGDRSAGRRRAPDARHAARLAHLAVTNELLVELLARAQTGEADRDLGLVA